MGFYVYNEKGEQIAYVNAGENNMGFYVYNEKGEQIAYVNATDILEAYKKAEAVTGIAQDDLSVEPAGKLGGRPITDHTEKGEKNRAAVRKHRQKSKQEEGRNEIKSDA